MVAKTTGTTGTTGTAVQADAIKKTETAKKALPAKKTRTVKNTPVTEKSEVAEKTSDIAKTEVVEKLTGEVVCTSIFKTEKEELYKRLCSDIQKEIKNTYTAFLSLAQKLYVIRTKKLFEIENYLNVYDMAQEKFGISRCTCNNFINICEKFGKIETGECIDLLPEYKDYTSSQLVEMISVPKEHRSKFTPDMSVREMKRQKNIYKNYGVVLEDTKRTSNATPKMKRVKLLELSDISEVLQSDNTILTDKLAEFNIEHPDAEYQLSISIEYKE